MLDKVHELMKVHLPDLLAQLGRLIESLERDVGWDEDRGAEAQ